MPSEKPSRKRQKIGKRSSSKSKLRLATLDDDGDFEPLGSSKHVWEDEDKDDEERRLESILFGKPYVPSSKGRTGGESGEEDDGRPEADVDLAGNEFANLMDSELFMVDGGEGDPALVTVPSGSEDEDEGGDEDGSEGESTPALWKQKSQKKGPAWVDPDDLDLRVSLASNKRLRKLRDTVAEDEIGGRDYERRLRRQFEKVNPTPQWASDARKKRSTIKRRRSVSPSSPVSEENLDLLTSTGGILEGEQRRSKTLSPKTINIERLRDANLSARAEGGLRTVQFHPSPQVPMLLTASADRRLRLFNIDGHTNPHIQTLHIPELPLTNACFHPNGTSILLTGPRPFYYTYDLQSGTSYRSPRGLWGTTFTDKRSTDTNASLQTCSFSSTGEMLAVAGRRGYTHLVDWKATASGSQVIGSVKMNSTVKSLWWNNQGELLSLGEDSEVYVWDVGERRCVRRWKDDGGYGSKLIMGDRGNRHLATGSTSGYVNVYGAGETFGTGSDKPKPLKTLGNLNTAISTLTFNHDSQLLAMASDDRKDQLRLVHLSSLTVYSYWPTSGTPLGRVLSVDFSADSQYIAIGNNRGRALLYHLRDFSES
ncbi:WD40 repeat-like protein [Thelephora ganbajun]|uniref:WD40 repeat-like protein n=1 Tax=Thelephora ganbajun TaxID=370292 RepID=A0ACB6ZHP1_THEGA|nr:WD40 repeat-like protein [Thelephora ganbajun]